MSEERTCRNCACSIVIKHPQLLNQTVMLCRRNPPFIIQQQGAKGVEQGLTHAPTSPELTCFDGWRPEGTLPGSRFYKYRMNDDASLALLTGEDSSPHSA